MVNETGMITEDNTVEKTELDTSKQPINEVPLWLRLTLTLDEANALSGIGIGKLRELAKKEDCPFILWNGGKHLFKREELERFLEESFSI